MKVLRYIWICHKPTFICSLVVFGLWCVMAVPWSNFAARVFALLLPSQAEVVVYFAPNITIDLQEITNSFLPFAKVSILRAPLLQQEISAQVQIDVHAANLEELVGDRVSLKGDAIDQDKILHVLRSLGLQKDIVYMQELTPHSFFAKEEIWFVVWVLCIPMTLVVFFVFLIGVIHEQLRDFLRLNGTSFRGFGYILIFICFGVFTSIVWLQTDWQNFKQNGLFVGGYCVFSMVFFECLLFVEDKKKFLK